MAEAKSKKAARPKREIRPLFGGYAPLESALDEMFRADGKPRPGLTPLLRHLDRSGEDDFKYRQRLADNAFLRGGVTFSVYSDRRGVEKIFPFDLIPRVITAGDWETVERGLIQRVTALNLFLSDLYAGKPEEARAVREDIVPKAMVRRSSGFLTKAQGVKPAGGVFVQIAGIDLIRGADGKFVVLEDNLRCPSGVSYVLENRAVMRRVFPGLFARNGVRPVDEYATKLREALGELSPRAAEESRIVVLTPGPYNSAYFEHSFLARRMGCELVQGSDLFIHKDRVYVKTTTGPSRVDVIYRRLDDEFLDPKAFRKDSLLGVPGLFRAYAKGNVTLANAVGNGVADDKGIYPFVPDLIRFYLSEEPILGQVETYVCARREDRDYVVDNLRHLVVKAVDGSGGYGMLMGPKASRAERDEFARKIRARPREYIAQPLIELSTCPTWTKKGVAPRRVDLRPYVITGKRSWVLPGGLTRVALREGSYVVNSSQGGGSKDTWVLEGASK